MPYDPTISHKQQLEKDGIFGGQKPPDPIPAPPKGNMSEPFKLHIYSDKGYRTATVYSPTQEGVTELAAELSACLNYQKEYWQALTALREAAEEFLSCAGVPPSNIIQSALALAREAEDKQRALRKLFGVKPLGHLGIEDGTNK